MHQPLAYIHSVVEIDRNVVIDPFVTIEKDVIIGKDRGLAPMLQLWKVPE